MKKKRLGFWHFLISQGQEKITKSVKSEKNDNLRK